MLSKCRLAGLPPERSYYEGRNHAADSILGLYLGTFRKPKAACAFYIYEIPSIGGYKIGIDSTGKRASQSQGLYGDQLLNFEGSRRDMWLLEQAILRALPGDFNDPGLQKLPQKWHGYTEIRFGDSVRLISVASMLLAELKEVGWCDFAIAHICMCDDERAMCRLLTAEQGGDDSAGREDGQLRLL